MRLKVFHESMHDKAEPSQRVELMLGVYGEEIWAYLDVSVIGSGDSEKFAQALKEWLTTYTDGQEAP